MPIKKPRHGRGSFGKRHHTNRHQRILVVDDDEDIRRLNTEVLTNAGYRADSAADGAIAWSALQLHDYDLLLTDQVMPNVSGLNLIKRLRAARMSMPVIVVSGSMPVKGLCQHSWLQIDSTLLKPYTSDELLATVRKVLYATDGVPGRPDHSLKKVKRLNNLSTMKHNHNHNNAPNPGSQLVPVRFEFTHLTAKTVSVAGTFNHWQPEAKTLHSSDTGNWWKETNLAPGTYEYCFVVDGQWIPDPQAKETVANPFGGKNSILTVAGNA
jgi:DNA-binding response OmpR family regulator